MRLLLSEQARRTILIAVGFCLSFAALFVGVRYLLDWQSGSVAAVMAQVDNYEVKSRLFVEAMDQVGVCSPEDAAVVWANGLEARSGALQYSAMNASLKQEYARQLDKNYPNWVTGVSSPWVSGYKITNIQTIGADQYAIQLAVSTDTSQGPYADYKAVLLVAREGDFWRITNISADPDLSAYMGFQP